MKAEFHGLLDEHTEGLCKPLYLQGRNGLAVDLDGPALRIEQPERAAMFYPLSRLARVLSKGGVQWSCAALLACADGGIPVVFLDAGGGVRGYLFGSLAGEDTLYRRLRQCLCRVDGVRGYQDWRCMMAVHAQRALERQLRQAGVDLDSMVAGQPVRSDREARFSTGPRLQLPPILFGLLAGLSVQLWIEAGLNAQRLADLEPLPLVDDLAQLLGWAVVGPFLLASRDNIESRLAWRDERALIAFVEGRRDELLAFGRVLLTRLREWLMEL
ncbi:MAG: CRISPR-associated endonuclease Cas1 [Candidatus Competibacteraceae bacterium]|nr:CRISPR-associated endonuclease Cas1 [Candidatus Competibacteraceae bacterium]